jgi:alkylhydroperoxidase family enzyme
MPDLPISRYPVPDLATLPADIRARIDEVQKKAGFVPNVFLTLAHRPDEFRAFFALKVATDSSALVDADYEQVRAAGFSDEDIWDIGAIAAFFALSNRMANLIGMRPNDEFYLMGRVPRPTGAVARPL